jgi:transketolase
MTIFIPADAPETWEAVQAAVEINGPVYIRLGRLGVPILPRQEDSVFQPGKAVMLRQGYDATIIATGIMVHQALIAAEKLAREGKQVRVLNIHTLKPLDIAAIVKAAEETGLLVTAEEHSIIGGLGSAVAEVTGEYCPVPVKRVGLPDVFGESGKAEELLEKYGLTPQNLVATVEKLIDKKIQLAYK